MFWMYSSSYSGIGIAGQSNGNPELFLLPVSKVSRNAARNAWDPDALLFPKYDEKRLEDYSLAAFTSETKKRPE